MSTETRSMAYPVLPIKNTVVFPKMMAPLTVGREASVAAVEAAMASEDKMLIVVTQNDPTKEETTRDDLFSIGTLVVIKRTDREGEMMLVMVHGIQRVELLEPECDSPYLQVRCRLLPHPQDNGTEVEALHRALLEVGGNIAKLLESHMPFPVMQLLQQTDDPIYQAYMMASLFGIDVEKAKTLLAASTRVEVLRLALEYLSYELQVLELRQRITDEAKSAMSREMRDHVLRHQLQAIREQLGEESPEQADAAELRRRIAETELPENVRAEAEKELKRLERMSANAADYQVTRTYLELICEMPWTATTDDVLDLRRAREVLDADHFGLKEIKERIIEHLAVMKRNSSAQAPILCFVGPPGVGKTSLGQSIARALGRKFERMSLGGLHDEAELRGHRRTYIGAMPGRVIQAIRRAGVRNPLLMLDEIDKLGRDFRGDPAAALMEILDPAQNCQFHDNYLDLPFDLSKVFFITTANTLDGIPRPLLDRMEILRLAGYSDEEKLQIARRYLLPRQTSQAGFAKEELVIPGDALAYIIRRYTREAGVRELERMLARVARKIAAIFEEGRERPPNPPRGRKMPVISIAKGKTTIACVTRDALPDLLGPEKFFPEEARRKLPPGVAVGLAWTETGGEVLYVEAVCVPRSNENSEPLLTGHLGQVMEESAQAAYSYIRSRADDLGIDKGRFSNTGVHIHVPAGATPKDGPSAGLTLVTALASLYLGRPVPSDTAMTGEITLSGLVLPVGGIKEKVLAAHRAGLRRVILPKENEKDLSELPDSVRKAIQFVGVERIEDVLRVALPNRSRKGRCVAHARNRTERAMS